MLRVSRALMGGPIQALCKLGLVAVGVALAACSTTSPRPPPVQDKDAAAIGIQVSMRPLLGTPYVAQTVYFARLDDNLALLDVRASNFQKDGRVYLLNAPPGRYQPVAAVYKVGFIGPENSYVAYFQQEMLHAGSTVVAAGRLGFAGRHMVKLEMGLCSKDADLVQLRYAAILAPGVPKCGLLSMLAYELATNTQVIGGQLMQTGATTYHYRGTWAETRREPADEEEFRSQAQGDLQAIGWNLQP